MCENLIFYFGVLSLIIAKISSIDENEAVVSTTPNSLTTQNVQDRLAKIENHINILADKIAQAELKNLDNKSKKKSLLKNCKDVQRTTNISGIYLIQPDSAPKPFMVVCDMETHGGGWTYFLNRFDGTQDFYQNWKSYKEGFGNLGKEFWLGLERLYQLTGEEINELLIELVDWDLKKVYAHYDFFSIGSEDEGYALKLLSGYNGTAGDSFSYHGGMKFSTKDNDQDADSGQCATYHNGAWWYHSCMECHLTGKYKKGTVSSSEKFKIMYWNEFHGATYSLKEARMMVRPIDEASSSFVLHRTTK